MVLNVKDYVAKQWHGTLLIIAISMVGFLFNTVLAAKLPLIEGILVILHLLGILVVVPLLVLLPTRSGGSVFVDYYNGGEWKTNGVSAMVGMLPVFSSLLGLDCTIHMCVVVSSVCNLTI